MALKVKPISRMTMFKLNYNKLISGILSLGVIVAALFILEYLFHTTSLILFLATLVIASSVFWKLLRGLYDVDKSKKAILLLINTSLLVLFLFAALYLASARVLMKVDPSLECIKAIECTWSSCPIVLNISDLCFFTQQFLAANIQFTGIEILYLILARGIGDIFLR
jgi:hypothetical protein